jgi:hypothetical protein
MLLILLEVKCWPPFHLWELYDKPEVCPGGCKLTLLHPKNSLSSHFQIIYCFFHLSPGSNPTYPNPLFQSTAEIEYP